MFDKYQRRADSLPGRMVSADDISSNQPWYDPSYQYQPIAESGPSRIQAADDPRVPYTPIENDMRRYQARANSGPRSIYASDDIALGRVGRKSGSLMRSVRGVRGLGDAAATTCVGFDPSKWMGPILGYTLDGTASGTLDTAQMNAIFGADTVVCADTYSKQRMQAFGNACAGGATPKDIVLCSIAKVLDELGLDADRVRDAARRMRERGWWTSENWYFYWCYLSGSKPFYLNPLALAGIGIAGVGGWYAYKKWIK